MMRETTVFGPIFSRRLGSSLGINLLPERGKICNFDCIYCECGWNKDGRGDTHLPSAEEVRNALEAKLSACAGAGTPIDSITFSGDGEPTLNPDFAAIVDLTLSLRDRYYPAARVSVLSNATRLDREDVFQALRRVDNPILKIDAPTDEGKGDGWSSADWVEEWMDLVRRLHPREVMVYTIDRETPQKGLEKYTVDEMRALVRPLIEEGYQLQIKG